MKAPGTLMVPNSAEQVALISSALVSVMVILVGDYYRSISRRELSDLHELHELSATLASIPGLPDQLQLILTTFARMHGATQGLICTYDARRDRLERRRQCRLQRARARELRDRMAIGAPRWPASSSARVVVEDIETDARFADFARFARAMACARCIRRR